MKKILVPALVIFCYFFAIGQDLPQFSEKASKDSYGGNGNTSTEGVLLWDNSTSVGPQSSGIISSRLRGISETNDVTCADDFVIPVLAQWSIDSLWFEAFLSTATLQPDSITVTFRNNNGGVPGAILQERRFSGVTVGVGTISPVGLKFQSPIVLTEGTYWVEVLSVYDTATVLTTGRMNWRYGNIALGLNSHIRARATYFGAPFDWTPVSSLVPADLSQVFKLFGTASVVPVELTSFIASVIGDQVELNWTTATELNNKGFEVQRSSSDNQFLTVGFVNGHGTTAQTQSYSFIDKNTVPGKYFYRLKQVDLDGSYEYSNIVEVEIISPSVFSLEQNYPNPFNPSTKISFSVAVDSKVDVTIFNVLGQEIASIFSGNISAGKHNINFDASNLNSGMYVYKMTANGNDGTNFSSIKKMMLTK